MKPDYRAPLLLGFAHAVSDCSAGYMVGSFSGEDGLLAPGALLLLYNILAFGGQLPAGMLVDRSNAARGGAAFSLLLMGLALLSQVLWPGGAVAAVTLAGLGSALFHVCGGSLAFSSTPDRAGGPGIFAAPGVMGLAFGGWMAWSGVAASFWLFLLLAVLALLVLRLRIPANQVADLRPAPQMGMHLDRHDAWMLLLLLAIGMRSAVWNLWVVIQEGDHSLLIASALAAMTGKLSGGFLADWLGWRRYTLGALLLAAPLLSLGEDRPWLFLPGLALLQSATAPTLALIRRTLPATPATAAGMGFGLAIALGGLPFLLGFAPSDWLFWAGPCAVVLILLLGGRFVLAPKHR